MLPLGVAGGLQAAGPQGHSYDVIGPVAKNRTTILIRVVFSRDWQRNYCAFHVG